MPVLDLVTPWAQATNSSHPARERAAFRTRWSEPLETFRRQRTPLATLLPLATHPEHAAKLARDPALASRIREVRASLTELGIAPPTLTTVLLATEAPGSPGEAIPERDSPLIYLCLDRITGDAELVKAWVRGAIFLIRWMGRHPAAPRWDRWEAAGSVPLAEWVYAAGLAAHAVRIVLPGLEPHEQFGMSKGSFQRLREHERALTERLAADLPLTGLGPWLRWFGEEVGAPPSIRSDGGPPIPSGAGRYLAWRLTTERVARVGLAEAIALDE
jgi:hypothetical protein